MNIYMTPEWALWIMERQARLRLLGTMICGTISMAMPWVPIKLVAVLLMGWFLLIRVRLRLF